VRIPRKLPKSFYLDDTVSVARALLGCVLWRRIGDEVLAARIVETEAYLGANDLASHARRGLRSARNESMYLEGGHAYVYFTYGMHWCLNAVTERVDYPAAVLIRALEPLAGIALMRRRRGPVPDRALCAGPARLCEALGITGEQNGGSLERGAIRIFAGGRTRFRVAVTPRIGITTARDWPLRFVIADSRWLSR
jgi:DNA-3-methyladenine glycosylase